MHQMASLNMQRFALPLLALPFLAARVMAEEEAAVVSLRPRPAVWRVRAWGCIEGGQVLGPRSTGFWLVHRAATRIAACSHSLPGRGSLHDCTRTVPASQRDVSCLLGLTTTSDPEAASLPTPSFPRASDEDPIHPFPPSLPLARVCTLLSQRVIPQP